MCHLYLEPTTVLNFTRLYDASLVITTKYVSRDRHVIILYSTKNYLKKVASFSKIIAHTKFQSHTLSDASDILNLNILKASMFILLMP